MKLFHLIWVLGLAGVVAGCNSGPPVSGCPNGISEETGECCPRGVSQVTGACCPTGVDPDTGDCNSTGGGGGGTGGGGGETGACTNADDSAVYGGLTYTTGGGASESGSDAASAIASDCVFGTQLSDPKNPGCGAEAQAVLICAASGCPQETVDALALCVVNCTQTLIDEVTGAMLSTDCAACYGESVACSASNCATAGCTNPNSTSCIQCRCDFDCTPGFDRCSGLPPSGDCN